MNRQKVNGRLYNVEPLAMGRYEISSYHEGVNPPILVACIEPSKTRIETFRLRDCSKHDLIPLQKDLYELFDILAFVERDDVPDSTKEDSDFLRNYEPKETE